MPTTSADPAPTRSFWVPVICGAVILTIGIGARQSFGIFQKPNALDLKVGRELWSFGNALSMLLMGVLFALRRQRRRPLRHGAHRRCRRRRLRRRHADDRGGDEGVLLTLGNALTGVGMAAGAAPSTTRSRPASGRT